jgi:hypothetical protein
MDARVAVVTSPSNIQTAEEGVSWHMPIRLNPCLDPFARALPCLTSGAAFDARHALSVHFPEEFEAPEGEPTRHAGMKATEAQDAGLLRCDLQVEFPQPLRERLVNRAASLRNRKAQTSRVARGNLTPAPSRNRT